MSQSRCLIGTLALFVLLTIGLVSVLIWREITRNEGRAEKISTSTLRSVYPGYFKTEEEHEEYARQLINVNTVNMTQVPLKDNQTVYTKPNTCNRTLISCQSNGLRRKRDATHVLHGCCSSTVGFVRPLAHPNTQNIVRRLVQFPGATQNFMINVCQPIVGCFGSVCSQGQNLYTAVVYKTGVSDSDDMDDTEVDFFYFDGCCKSVNI